jgi:hypothetical protein
MGFIQAGFEEVVMGREILDVAEVYARTNPRPAVLRSATKS